MDLLRAHFRGEEGFVRLTGCEQVTAHTATPALNHCCAARDTSASQALMNSGGLTCHSCHNLAEVCTQLAHGAGALVVPEEAILHGRDASAGSGFRRDTGLREHGPLGDRESD